MKPVFLVYSEVTEEKLEFAKQIGVTGIIAHTLKLPGDSCWDGGEGAPAKWQYKD